jgi:dihydroceramidase
MAVHAGYWLPHTSSIQFCEEDYLFTPYVAEIHNTWSSLVGISLFPFLGLLFSNPTREFRFTVMYLVLMGVGIGSAALHATLMALPQSFDEVPMLWMNTTILYALLENKSPPQKGLYSYLPYVMLGMAAVQTYVYYTFQRYYAVFLSTYVAYVVIVVVWTCYLALYEAKELPRKLWFSALISYVLIGSPLWIVEMNYCDHFLPWFRAAAGVTFHILWHIGAGVGTYLTILFLIALRLDTVYRERAELAFVCGFCPVIVKAGQAAATAAPSKSRGAASASNRRTTPALPPEAPVRSSARLRSKN